MKRSRGYDIAVIITLLVVWGFIVYSVLDALR